MPQSNTLTVSQQMLQVVRVHAGRVLSSRGICEGNVKLEHKASSIGRALAYDLVAELAALPTEIVRSEDVRTPATWWDALKHHVGSRWWARWFVRRWPARYRTHTLTVTVRVVAPGIQIPMRHDGWFAVTSHSLHTGEPHV